MLAFLGSVFVASVLGSLHCVGMCGPLVSLAIPRRSARKPLRPTLSYHGGRLVCYVAVGALAGAVGGALERGGELLGAQQTAALLAGGLMITIGAAQLLRLAGLRLPVGAPTARITAVLRAGTARAASLRPSSRAAALGFLTGFMPCGWLYVFAVAAAGTASIPAGAATMAAFWLGTTPALTVVALATSRAAISVRSRLPWVIPCIVIAIGVYTVAFRAEVAPAPSSPTQTEATEAPCH